MARLPGISELHSRIVFSATIDLDDVPQPLNCQVLSLPDLPRPVINQIVLRQGDYFSEPLESNEFEKRIRIAQ